VLPLILRALVRRPACAGGISVRGSLTLGRRITLAGRVIHIGALGPLAIGGAVFAAHLALLPIDGTSINPARSIGPAIVYGEWRQRMPTLSVSIDCLTQRARSDWAFWFGPYAGALAAASIYELFLKGQVEDGSGVEKEK